MNNNRRPGQERNTQVFIHVKAFAFAKFEQKIPWTV